MDGRRTAVERATPGDLITLAVDAGVLPSHVGAVLRFAGTLAVTLVADPDAVPDLSGLAAALRTERSSLSRSAEAVGQRASVSPNAG